MMKRLSLSLPAALALLIFCSCKSGDKPATSSMTVFDTARMMLYDFVAQGNDMRLGFDNPNDILRSHIAVDSGISMYILGVGNKLRTAGDSEALGLHLEMEKLARKIYPVYCGDTLHSTITFDSTPRGLVPISFGDGRSFYQILEDMKENGTVHPGETYGFVMTDAVQNTLVTRHDSTGDYVLHSEELQNEMKENYPAPTPHHLVKKDEFLRGLERHIMKERERKKARKRR
ncbi:MAG: hypothetical protein ABI778_12560 [Ignavibacteriota bacterium]